MLIITFFVFGFILSSLIEYWIHRLMHIFPWFGAVSLHYKHHYEESYGIWKDFKSYSQLVLLLCPMFLISWSAGISTSLGGLVFTAFAAYTHQLQHENPTNCFWMEVPIHYLHHKYDCNSNFGLSIDWWDRVFKTYKPNQWFIHEELNQINSAKSYRLSQATKDLYLIRLLKVIYGNRI